MRKLIIIIGRKDEIKRLNKCLDADSSSFVVLYGRRRVGKTFLINEVYKDNIAFRHTGSRIGNMREQIKAFADSLKDAGLSNFSEPNSWIDAFSLLKDLIKKTDKKRSYSLMNLPGWAKMILYCYPH